MNYGVNSVSDRSNHEKIRKDKESQEKMKYEKNRKWKDREERR